jgi:hypothetical protein
MRWSAPASSCALREEQRAARVTGSELNLAGNRDRESRNCSIARPYGRSRTL